MRNMKHANWGSAVLALLLILGSSFFGTLAAGIILLLIVGLTMGWMISAITSAERKNFLSESSHQISSTS